MKDSTALINKDLALKVKKAMRAFSDDILICIVNAHGGTIEIPVHQVRQVHDKLNVHVNDEKIILTSHPI